MTLDREIEVHLGAMGPQPIKVTAHCERHFDGQVVVSVESARLRFTNRLHPESVMWLDVWDSLSDVAKKHIETRLGIEALKKG